MLRRPEVAVLINMHLENTTWTASQIARFLSTPSLDIPRAPGASATWMDVYDDAESTIEILANVTKVPHLCCVSEKTSIQLAKHQHIPQLVFI